MKTKISFKHFMEGTKVNGYYIVEVCVGRRWSPVGDDSGIRKFPTREAAAVFEATVAAASPASSSAQKGGGL